MKAEDTRQRHGAIPVPNTADGVGNTLVAPLVALVNPDGTSVGGGAATGAHGVAGIPFTSANATTAAPITDAPPAGKFVNLTDLFISTDTDLTVTIKEETSGTVIAGPFYIAAKVPVQFTPLSNRWKTAVAAKKMMVQTSGAGNIMVDAHYNYGS